MTITLQYSFFFILFICFATCDEQKTPIKTTIISVDVKNTKVWGPGIDSPENIVLPVRYFYIQAFDKFGKPINTSAYHNFYVALKGNSLSGKCRVRIEQYDRRDGVYIVQYKVFEMCWNVEIHIQYNQQHVAKSPYRVTGNVYSDKCRCPRDDIQQWLETFKCDSSYPQIDADLKPFKRVNFSEIRPKILRTYDQPGSISICNYVVKNNHIYRKCYGQYTGFKMFIDTLLTTLVRIVKLPDFEFIANLGDWPLVKKGGISRTMGPPPIFSWCGSEDSFDVVMPSYDLTQSTLEALTRVSIDILSVQNAKTVWIEKIPIAFWRGRDSRRERLLLVDIARKNPELFNVSLTNFFFFRDEEPKYGPKTPHVPFYEFFNYKYQVNLDGTVAAYRLPYLLAGNSVVFKQDSPFYEHFYKKLHPMQHFIPIKRDLSDLVDKIRWAQNNDDAAKKISQQAQNFVNENLTPDKILCYYVVLFKEWNKRLIDPVEVLENMEHLLVEDSNECDCTKKSRDEFKWHSKSNTSFELMVENIIE